MSNTKTKSNTIFNTMFKNFKNNFKELFISNLFFSIPFIILQLLLLLSNQFIPMSIFLYLIPVIILAPFYGGLTYVAKEIIIGNTVNKHKTFIEGFKKNFKQMLILGIIYYILILISYFAIVLYYSAGLQNSMFFIMLGLAVILAILIFATMFYVPILSITIDLKIFHILKNAALMAVFEIPTNFVIILSLLAITAIVSSIFMLLSNFILIVIFSCLLSLIILPMLIAFLINSLAYPKIERLITDTSSKPQSNVENKTLSQEDLNSLNLTKDMLKGNDDYIFINGRMIKKSLVENHLNRNTYEDEE